MDHQEQKLTHPPKWRETVDPFTLNYSTFRPEEILGYPHAGNDVFHIRGFVNGKPITAYFILHGRIRRGTEPHSRP